MHPVVLVFFFCTFFCPLGDCIKFDTTPRDLMLKFVNEVDPESTNYGGMEDFISLLEESSLVDFIRLKRCRTFDFNHYYRPSAQRLKDNLNRLIKGEIPLSVINDLISINLFDNNTRLLKILLENQPIMEKLYLTLTDPMYLEYWNNEEKSKLLTLIVKKQYRKVYSGHFYLLFATEDIIFKQENWEFFDVLFWRVVRDYEGKRLLELVHLLIPMAKKDDFAFFRLNVPFIKADGEDLFNLTKDEYFKDLRTSGTPIQKAIITLGKRLSSKNHWLRHRLSGVSSATEISQVYYHFKKLLELRQDVSPAFLLELLATTIPINTEEKAFELLKDLVRSYPAETISPYHLYYTLGYFPEIARKFRGFGEELGEEWKKLFNEKIFMYYLPNSALTQEELLNLWSASYTALKPPHLEWIQHFFDGEDHGGVMKIVDGEFRFVCDKTYDDYLTSRFISAGFDLTSTGSDDFLNRLPKYLKTLVYKIMESGPEAIPENLAANKDFISQICVDPETATFESVKSIIENLELLQFNDYAFNLSLL